MADRYYMAVAINGKYVDFGYYRNWFTDYLFYEAVTVAALFHDCTTKEEYLVKRYGTKDVCFRFCGETLKSSHNAIADILGYSEMTVIVDLTQKSIYVSDRILKPRKLFRRPDITSPLHGNFNEHLRSGRFSFREFDCEGYLAMIRANEGFERVLSTEVHDLVGRSADRFSA